MSAYHKDPDAVLDWQFDWSDWLADSETISTPTITITPTGELAAGTPGINSGVVRVWLTGGTAGETYLVACKIVTSAGRTDERTIKINCFER